MFISVGGGQEIQCRRFFAIDVVPVKFTKYSLSRLIRKMSDIYPPSHFVSHPVPPVPQLVQKLCMDRHRRNNSVDLNRFILKHF